MIIFIVSVITAIICYLIGKKIAVFKNNFEIIRHILWIEACVFMAGYFFTDKAIYKLIWSILIAAASIFSLVYDICYKKKK